MQNSKIFVLINMAVVDGGLLYKGCNSINLLKNHELLVVTGDAYANLSGRTSWQITLSVTPAAASI